MAAFSGGRALRVAPPVPCRRQPAAPARAALFLFAPSRNSRRPSPPDTANPAAPPAPPRTDPQDRSDGTNVGGWHWREVQALPWARQRLSELLDGAVLVDDPSTQTRLAVVAGSVEATGDCTVNLRKGKIIPFYELEVCLRWEGTAGPEGKRCAGSAETTLGVENADEAPAWRATADARLDRGETDVDEPTQDAARGAVVRGASRAKLAELIARFHEGMEKGGPAAAEIAAARAGAAAGAGGEGAGAAAGK